MGHCRTSITFTGSSDAAHSAQRHSGHKCTAHPSVPACVCSDLWGLGGHMHAPLERAHFSEQPLEDCPRHRGGTNHTLPMTTRRVSGCREWTSKRRARRTRNFTYISWPNVSAIVLSATVDVRLANCLSSLRSLALASFVHPIDNRGSWKIGQYKVCVRPSSLYTKTRGMRNTLNMPQLCYFLAVICGLLL